MKLTVDTLAQNSCDGDIFSGLHRQASAQILRHTDDNLRNELTVRFSDFQLLVRSGGDLVGAVLSLPLYWNGAIESLPVSKEDVLIRAIGCRELKKSPNTLVCLAVATINSSSGNGLHSDIMATLRNWTSQQGFTALMAVVRPSRKAEYPLTPLDQYIHWRTTDGSPFDPELRMHWDMGASVLCTMLQAVTLEGDLSTWEHRTGTHYSESGEYIAEGALKPVLIDCENDYGFYQEANIWVAHKPPE